MTTDQVRELLEHPTRCPICGESSYPVISITLDHIAKVHE